MFLRDVVVSTGGQVVIARLPVDRPDRVGHLGVLAGEAAFAAGEPWLDRLLAYLDGTRRHGRVALASGPDFGAPGRGFVRLNLGTSRALVEEAVDRRAAAVAAGRP